MSRIIFNGQENIPRRASLYMPNRLTGEGMKKLHSSLKAKLCFLSDPSFPPTEEQAAMLLKLKVEIVEFNFRASSSLALREQLTNRLDAGQNIVFLPGKISKTKGTLSDVPSPFLKHLAGLHLSPVPIFTGFYGDDYKDCFMAFPGKYRELVSILPQLPPGPQTGERLLRAWMDCSAQNFSQQPLLEQSLASSLVRSMRKYSKLLVTDGMTETNLPFFKILGVSMTVARRLRKDASLKRIGVILPPGPGAIIATLSCLLAGITPVMINYASSRAAFASTVKQAGLTRFISARKFMEKLPSFSWPDADRMILVEDLLHQLDKKTLVANVLMAKVAPAGLICRMFDTDKRKGDDEAIMLFTSGSSGEPKGVALTHRMIQANVAQCASRIDLQNEHFLGSLPVFHSFGLTVTMLLPLLTGYPICSYPNPTDAKRLCELTAKYKLSMLCATPTFARAMIRRANPDTFRHVHYFIVGAEKLSPELENEFFERFGVQLLEGYGMTEATPVCSVNLPNAPRLVDSAFYVPGHTARSIGAALPGMSVRITDIDDDTREIPPSEQGMLWIKGANVFSGYIGKPELNSSIFSGDWFKTGDIGKVDLNGFITLGGRLSRFSKIGGEMVPHEGVEQVLSHILPLDIETGVQQIAITGVSDEQKGEAIVLLSTLAQHRNSSEERENLSQIRTAMIEQHASNLWIPKYIVPVEAIPVLPTGKLDLRGCKLLAQEALGVE